MKRPTNYELLLAITRIEERLIAFNDKFDEKTDATNAWQEKHETNDNMNHASVTKSINKLNNFSVKVGFVCSVITGSFMFLINKYWGGNQ